MQSIGLAAIRPTSQHKISTPKFGKAENTKNQKNNRQIFRVQNIKLTPNFKTNASQQPSQTENLVKMLADCSAQIKQLQNQLAESQKQNELLDQRLKKANQTVAEYWIRVKDQEKFVQTTKQSFQTLSNKYKNTREKKKMYKRRIIDALNYFYSRYTDAYQQNAPFLQLEEMRQILLSLGMHESIVQEMQQINSQNQNRQVDNVDNMTYEQLLALQERIGTQHVGLTKEQIKLLPKHIKQEQDNVFEICTICYEQLEVGNKYRTLPCAHLYHSKCIKAWLINHKKCPICNVEVVSEQQQQ